VVTTLFCVVLQGLEHSRLVTFIFLLRTSLARAVISPSSTSLVTTFSMSPSLNRPRFPVVTFMTWTWQERRNLKQWQTQSNQETQLVEPPVSVALIQTHCPHHQAFFSRNALALQACELTGLNRKHSCRLGRRTRWAVRLTLNGTTESEGSTIMAPDWTLFCSCFRFCHAAVTPPSHAMYADDPHPGSLSPESSPL
jgi:hypothetical protein